MGRVDKRREEIRRLKGFFSSSRNLEKQSKKMMLER